MHPKTISPLILISLLIGAALARGPADELPIAGSSVAVFATPEQGQAVIGRFDEYAQRMSAFDRKLRMDQEAAVSAREFLRFAAAQVTAWPDSERERIAAVMETLAMRLQGLRVPLPPRVLLIRTTGHEEEGEAHTRGHAIVLPARSTGGDAGELLALLSHELFHVMSRHDGALREALYALIGFQRCPEIALPPELEGRRITNPDAPKLDTYIEVRTAGTAVAVAPLLLTRADFSLQRGVALQDYWQLRFLALRRGAENEMRPILRDGAPVLYSLGELEGFFEQVGSNTQYLIDPEEILADNFALLVTGKAAREPERVAQLKSLLQRY